MFLLISGSGLYLVTNKTHIQRSPDVEIIVGFIDKRLWNRSYINICSLSLFPFFPLSPELVFLSVHLFAGVGVFKIEGKLYQFAAEAPGHICHNGFNVEAHHTCRRSRDETEYSECKYKLNLRVCSSMLFDRIRRYEGTYRLHL